VFSTSCFVRAPRPDKIWKDASAPGQKVAARTKSSAAQTKKYWNISKVKQNLQEVKYLFEKT